MPIDLHTLELARSSNCIHNWIASSMLTAQQHSNNFINIFYTTVFFFFSFKPTWFSLRWCFYKKQKWTIQNKLRFGLRSTLHCFPLSHLNQASFPNKRLCMKIVSFLTYQHIKKKTFWSIGGFWLVLVKSLESTVKTNWNQIRITDRTRYHVSKRKSIHTLT